MANLCLYSAIALYFLCSFGTCEVIVANITKTAVLSKSVLSTKPNDISNLPVTVPPSVTSRSPTTSGKNDFQIPRAISIDAGHEGENEGTGSYSVFPLPPVFHFPGNDGLEEVFTYQVKKPGRSPLVHLPGISEELRNLQQNAKRESLETMHIVIAEFKKDIDMKVQRMASNVEDLSQGMIGNISAVTSAWDQLNQNVVNLTKVSKETIRTVRSMQLSIEQEAEEKKFLANQISNLTAEVSAVKQQGAENIDKLVEIMGNLQAKLDNMTNDIRVHEAHLRYGQQALTSMRETVDTSIDRITGLEQDGGQQWTEQTTGCGGVVVANAGIISYKFRQPYLNNERCVWTLRVNRKSKVTLQVLEDGFQNKSITDFLTVTEFAQDQDQHPVTLITNTRIEHGNTALHTFQGPVIFLTFYSDNDVTGTGFTLKFKGVGNRTDADNVNSIRHLNKHFVAPIGVFTYPSDSGATYQPHELLTITLNPMNANTLKVFMRRSDLEKDEVCDFDSVSFYGSVTGSYALTKRYCQQGESLTGEVIQSSDGIFIVVFRSDASTQYTGFQFSWEIS